eukprot:gene15997-17608_t
MACSNENQPQPSVLEKRVLQQRTIIDQIMKDRKKPFLIGVAGGTCCGKSEVCKKILKDLGQANVESEKRKVIILGQESFYRELSKEESALADASKFNFDHPGAFDDNLCLKTLQKLRKGEQAQIQNYNFKTHSGESEYRIVHPADVILFEGILVLYNKDIRDLLDMKIFVDTDSDTRLARRVLRDILEHGRDIDNVLNHYTKFVKPAFEDFTLPTKKHADVIIPRGADNTVAIDLIVQHIKDLLTERADGGAPKRIRHQSENGTSGIYLTIKEKAGLGGSGEGPKRQSKSKQLQFIGAGRCKHIMLQSSRDYNQFEAQTYALFRVSLNELSAIETRHQTEEPGFTFYTRRPGVEQGEVKILWIDEETKREEDEEVNQKLQISSSFQGNRVDILSQS